MILNKKISFPAYVMFQEFDSEAILLDIRSQEHFALDAVSSMFLKSIQEGSSIENASSIILEAYEVEAEQLHADLQKLIDTLLEHELIEIS